LHFVRCQLLNSRMIWAFRLPSVLQLTSIRSAHQRIPPVVPWRLDQGASRENRLEPRATLVLPVSPAGLTVDAIRTHRPRGLQETGHPISRRFRRCRPSHEGLTLRQISSRWQRIRSIDRSSEILDSYQICSQKCHSVPAAGNGRK
jgi:hypothetical protein